MATICFFMNFCLKAIRGHPPNKALACGQAEDLVDTRSSANGTAYTTRRERWLIKRISPYCSSVFHNNSVRSMISFTLTMSAGAYVAHEKH